MTSDLDLLKQYACDNSQDAFAEIVRRHLDLVHAAALRQVRSPQLAEEVAQSVFTDLARQAHRLAPDTILSAWLYEITRRTAIDVVRREARRQLREQIATEMNAMNATTADWAHVEPLLDEAMHALDKTDRAAVLLRYFENKSLREVGLALGTSDDTAQKRVSRAVERLREFFAQRGVAVGTGGLVVVISANAVQAAPVGLAITISTAATSAGTTIAAATATATKTIVMTALQKTLIATALAAAVGTGIYEARQTSELRTQVQTFQQQQATLNEQIQQLLHERDDATTRLAGLEAENLQLKVNQSPTELLRLRGEVTQLKAAVAQTEIDPTQAEAAAVANRVKELQQWLALTPDETIPELQLLTPRDWLFRAVNIPSDDNNEANASRMRTDAKMIFARSIGSALSNYLIAKNGQLPNELSELKPYFSTQVDEAILQRYELLHTGDLRALPQEETLVAEKTPMKNGQYDARFKIGAFDFSWQSVGPNPGTGRNSGNPFGVSQELKKILAKQ